jgi:hypothetical protein
LLHTGFAAWYLGQPRQVKNRLHVNVAAPGIEHTEAVCEYLWDSHAAAIACDTFGVEAFPADRSPAAHPFGFLHNMLIGQLGMALGELWWLSDRRDRLARQRRRHQIRQRPCPDVRPGRNPPGARPGVRPASGRASGPDRPQTARTAIPG